MTYQPFNPLFSLVKLFQTENIFSTKTFCAENLVKGKKKYFVWNLFEAKEAEKSFCVHKEFFFVACFLIIFRPRLEFLDRENFLVE